MKRGMTIVLALGLASAAVAAQKQGQPLGERPPQAVYAKTCGYCHGSNVGPILLGRSLPPEAIKAIVRSGQNAMPAFRPTEITDTELDGVAAWISTSRPSAKEKGR